MPFGNKRGQDKLYKQWLSHGDITDETKRQKSDNTRQIVHGDSRSDTEANSNEYTDAFQYSNTEGEIAKKDKQKPNSLYILLAVSIVLICVGLVLVLIVL
jgi:hypothetical protein